MSQRVKYLINTSYRSKWKYKLTAILLGILMVYMIFASIKCALEAAGQGGEANSVMLLSVVVTYGCEQDSSPFLCLCLH